MESSIDRLSHEEHLENFELRQKLAAAELAIERLENRCRSHRLEKWHHALRKSSILRRFTKGTLNQSNTKQTWDDSNTAAPNNKPAWDDSPDTDISCPSPAPYKAVNWDLVFEEDQDPSFKTVNQVTSESDLGKASRLFDESLSLTPARFCYIPLSRQVHYLEESLRHAQATLWDILGQYQPEVRQVTYSLGPYDIAFEWSPLSRVFGSDSNVLEAPEMCHQPREVVHKAITAVVELRNQFCHPQHGCALKRLDGLMRSAQRLTVLAEDEVRAHAVRKLRDELRLEAEHALREIETLLNVPENEWPPHQRKLAENIGFLPKDLQVEYPAVVMLAAQRFA